MSLYYVQDNDRPMWVVAPTFAIAIEKWRKVIRAENDGIEPEDGPSGIQHICDDDEFIP